MVWENVRKSTPILLLPIVFKVQLVVYPVVLVIAWIVPLFEIPRFWMNTTSFIVLPKCSLSVFQPILFESSCLHITVFKCSLVRSSSSICWSHNVLQSFGEVVDLKCVFRHVIHVIRHERWRIFLPHLLFFTSLEVYNSNLMVPVTFKRVRYFFCLPYLFVSLALKFKTFFTEPATSGKLYFALLFRIFQVGYCHSIPNIDVDLPNNKIVNTENWRF